MDWKKMRDMMYMHNVTPEFLIHAEMENEYNSK
jgi:hypothetical protein